MATNAVLAIIADGGRAIVVIYIEGVEINYVILYFIDSAKNPSTVASSNSLQKGFRGCGIFIHQNHAGDVCVLVFS